MTYDNKTIPRFKNYDECYNYHLARGIGHPDARYHADRWKRRNTQSCVHCHGKGWVNKSPHRPPDPSVPTDGCGNIIRGQVS